MFPTLHIGRRVLSKAEHGKRGLVVEGYAKLGVLDSFHPHTPVVEEGQVWFFEVKNETQPGSRKGVYILAPLRQVSTTTDVSQLEKVFSADHPNLSAAFRAKGAVRLETVLGTQVFVPVASINFRAMHVFPDGTAKTEGRLQTSLNPDRVAELLRGRPQSRSDQMPWVPALNEIALQEPRSEVSRLKRVTHNLLWLFGIIREERDNSASLLEAARWVQPRAQPQSARWKDETRRNLVVKYHDPREALGADGANIVPIQMVFMLNGLQLEVGVTKEGQRWLKQNSQEV